MMCMMMCRRIVFSVLFLMAVSCAQEPGRRWLRDVEQSEFNGFWTSGASGRSTGVVVVDLPEGPSWSPRGLTLQCTRMYLTHGCRDFLVDSETGRVLAAAGVRPLGRVTLDGGIAGLQWDTKAVAGDGDWSWELRLIWHRGFGCRPRGTVEPIRAEFHGTLTRTGENSASLAYQLVFLDEADAGVDEDSASIDLTRAKRCP